MFLDTFENGVICSTRAPRKLIWKMNIFLAGTPRPASFPSGQIVLARLSFGGARASVSSLPENVFVPGSLPPLWMIWRTLTRPYKLLPHRERILHTASWIERKAVIAF